MMTAEQLKGSILQLAMQGKLVEQRTSERIAVFKKGKGKETEELDFEIPMTWIIAHLETVVDSVASKQYQIKESEVKPEGKYRVISQSKEYSIGYCNDNSKLYHHTQPVIVFGDHTTEVKFIDFDFVVGADGIKIFNPNTDIIEPRFLFYQLQFYTRGLNKVGGYSRHYKFIKNKPIVIPPLAEQKRIVEKIEELMPFVEQYAAASTKLNMLNTTFPEMMKKSILQEAVQGKLVPQDPSDEPASVLLEKIAKEKKRLIKEGKIKKQKPLPEITEDEIPFDIPESWEWVRFSEIMNSISTGPFGSMLHKTDYENEGIPIVNPIHMQGRRIIPSSNSLISNKTAERLSSYKLQAGDIVLARRGDIGRSAVVHEAESGWICGTGSFFATPSKGINPDFISLMFTTPYVRQVLLGESVGTTMNNLNQKILLSFLFPLPPEKEQERILGAFDNLNRVLTGLATIS